MASADEKAPAQTGTALSLNLARQREVALGKRVVNTQGHEAIASADEKYLKAEDEDVPGWLP